MRLHRRLQIFITVSTLYLGSAYSSDNAARDDKHQTFARSVDSNFDRYPDAIAIGNNAHYATWVDIDHDGNWDLFEIDREGTRIDARLPHEGKFLRVDIHKRTTQGLLEVKLRFESLHNRYVASSIRLISKSYGFSEADCSPTTQDSIESDLGLSLVDETKKAALTESGAIDKSCKGPLYNDTLKAIAKSWADLQKKGEAYDAVTCMANHGWPQEAMRLQVFQERLANPNAIAKTVIQCHENLEQAGEFDPTTDTIRLSTKNGQLTSGNQSSDVVTHEVGHKAGMTSEKELKQMLACCGSKEKRNACKPEGSKPKNSTDREYGLKRFFDPFKNSAGLLDFLLEAQITLSPNDFLELQNEVKKIQQLSWGRLSNNNCDRSEKYNSKKCDDLVLSLRQELHEKAFSYCQKTSLTSEQCSALRKFADESVQTNLKNCSSSASNRQMCPAISLNIEDSRNTYLSDKVQGNKLGKQIAQEQRSGAAKVAADSVAVMGPPVNLKSPAEAKEAIRRSDFASADLVAAADGVVQMVREAPPTPEEGRSSQASGNGRSDQGSSRGYATGGNARVSSRSSVQGRQPAASGARVSARGLAGGSGSRHRGSAVMAMPETVAFSPNGNELPGSGKSGSSGQSNSGSLIGSVGSLGSARDSELSASAPRLFGAPVALSMRMMGSSSAGAATSEESGAPSGRGNVASGGSGSLMNAGGSGSSVPMAATAGGSSDGDDTKISPQKAMNDVRHSFERVRGYLDAQGSTKQQFMDILDKQRIQLSHPSLREPIGSSNAQWLYVYPNDTERPRRRKVSP